MKILKINSATKERRKIMRNITIPLVSPLSRKYYNYASNKDGHKHHRAEDIRICLEKVCDQIIYVFVSEQDKEKWKKYKLHNKLGSSRNFLDKKIVDKLISAKVLGNIGVHEGEEGNYTVEEIEESLNIVREFSLEVFYAYFKKNGFNHQNESWMPTVFSVLPPIYRVEILEKYYNNCDKSPFVIDKLSKAYLKNGSIEEANEFLKNCYEENEITFELYEVLFNDIQMLNKSISFLPISKDLETSKKNFNKLLLSIEENERDTFIYLMSMILNGTKV